MLSADVVTSGPGANDELKTTFTTAGANAGTYKGVGTASTNLTAVTVANNSSTKLSNFTITYSENAQATINTRDLHVYLDDDVEFTYDAKTHCLGTEAVSVGDDELVSGHTLSNSNTTFSSNNTGKNAGTYNNITVTAIKIVSGSTDVTANYNVDLTDAGSFTINKAKMTIDVVGSIEDDVTNFTYNGKAKSAYGYSAAERTTGENATNTKLFSLNYLTPGSTSCSATGTNAGTYYLKANGKELEADDFAYTDTNIDATINYTPGYVKISPAKVTIKVNDSMQYSAGKKFAHNITTDEVIGLVSGQKITGSLTTNTDEEGVYNTEGTAKEIPYFTADLNYAQGTLEDNYTIEYAVILNIKTQLVITVKGNHSSNDAETKTEYNGQTQQITGFTVSGSDSRFDESKFSIKSGHSAVASGVNAGTYSMGLESSDFEYKDESVEYYEIVVEDGWLKIDPKEITREMVEASYSPTSFVYNGKAQGPTFTIQNGSTTLTKRDFTVTNGEAVNVGTYYATVTGTGNYTSSIANLEWSITKASIEINITGNSDSRLYSGAEQSISGYTATVATPSAET